MNIENIALELIQQYYAQLQDLNYAISLRPEAERYPSIKEVDIMRKLLFCIKELRKEMAITENMELVTTINETPTVATTTVSATTATIHSATSLFTIPRRTEAQTKSSRISKASRKQARAGIRHTH